jgi:Zn-dependent oligopeptidase
MTKKYALRDSNKDSLFPASFGHLMGYDAGYYSYM